MKLYMSVNDVMIDVNLNNHREFDSFINEVYNKTGRETPIDFETDVIFYNSIVTTIDEVKEYLTKTKLSY